MGEDATDTGQLARGQETRSHGCGDHTEALETGTRGGGDFRLEGLSGNPGLSLDILATCLTVGVGVRGSGLSSEFSLPISPGLGGGYGSNLWSCSRVPPPPSPASPPQPPAPHPWERSCPVWTIRLVFLSLSFWPT